MWVWFKERHTFIHAGEEVDTVSEVEDLRVRHM